MKLKMFLHFSKTLAVILCCALLFACDKNNSADSFSLKNQTMQKQLLKLLEDPSLETQNRYSVINSISNIFFAQKDYNRLVLFLTDWTERHSDDIYNTYWLFITASVYMQNNAAPIAEYYFDRILKNYPDITVKGQSIHFQCLRQLIKISTTPANRIKYFNELISKFPMNVSITELYERLALEYEKEGEWELAMRAYSQFLEQPDAQTIQIAGVPDAYANARQLVDFNNSPKDWTFESLAALEEAIKKAISRYDWRLLDQYKSKVNFFTMNWNQDRSASNAQEVFSMRNFMRGNRIRYNENLDDGSNPNEAYLWTTGWSQYISVWYLCFRKVNFPADPEIHGRWEWAGIYFGERL
ncbi:tetratricopeptide repeat protein [Treponema parvum]|uniref:Tetratricopeptide repeat protein n=1 Tax=Treponema parvum TaxID=138851 RepID=A0A975IBK5_9SPIR|nr:tetratricopeptide repeat protein [Treponema parvum]QTQ11116.1 tetratricopeptide repeat protein [Treponema parvum]QTQ14725.1 tetratricopeptide repeat protein [Treponema parvum]QTQ16943.1 tetratricopeptide repeat protein [Treponema parvum]